jgi:hypothetical protein
MHNGRIQGDSEMSLSRLACSITVNARTFNPLVPGSNPGGVTLQNPYELRRIDHLTGTSPAGCLAYDDKIDDRTPADDLFVARYGRAPPSVDCS